MRCCHIASFIQGLALKSIRKRTPQGKISKKKLNDDAYSEHVFRPFPLVHDPAI